MYFTKLMPEGVLCVHTSNRHVDLVTPVVDIASKIGLAWRVGKDNGESGYRGHFGQEYVMLARDAKYLPAPDLAPGGSQPVISDLTGQEYMTWAAPRPEDLPEMRPAGVAAQNRAAWTDDYSNLAGALREQLAVQIFIYLFLGIGIFVVGLLWVSKIIETQRA
jgi:hypothetical protein